VRDGILHEFYVIPYPGRRIWGATAEILVDLARVLTRSNRGCWLSSWIGWSSKTPKVRGRP
jgi:hypothetical protein